MSSTGTINVIADCKRRSPSKGVLRADYDPAAIAAAYAKAGVPERVRTRLYDTPHEFNAEMQTEAWAWLARHLAT